MKLTSILRISRGRSKVKLKIKIKPRVLKKIAKTKAIVMKLAIIFLLIAVVTVYRFDMNCPIVAANYQLQNNRPNFQI